MQFLSIFVLLRLKELLAVDLIRLGGYLLYMQNEAGIFKALADETRLRILLLLLDGELCVCEIIAALELPQSTVSRHLAYLKKTGWVHDRKQGVWMYYQLRGDDDRLRKPLTAILQKSLADAPEVIQAFTRLEVFRRDHLQKGA